MTSLHQYRESAVEKLHSRWSSSSRVVGDRPPSQPLSCRPIVGGPSSDSVKEIHYKDQGVGDALRRGNTFRMLQQQSDSKWTIGSGVIIDRPPLQPLSCRGSAVGRLQESDSRRHRPARSLAIKCSWDQAVPRHSSTQLRRRIRLYLKLQFGLSAP
jgi:hypothetical protein